MPRIRALIVLACFCLSSLLIVKADEQLKRSDDGESTISLQTLDQDVQQIDLDEIWRIRAASAYDEPADATVLDYAFERVFVKDPLKKVVSRMGEHRDVKRFTLPSGAPVYIVSEKVIGIARALPNQHHRKSRSIIIAREGQQQVQESRQAVRDALGK
jgi:hypothetical protein